MKTHQLFPVAPHASLLTPSSPGGRERTYRSLKLRCDGRGRGSPAEHGKELFSFRSHLRSTLAWVRISFHPLWEKFVFFVLRKQTRTKFSSREAAGEGHGKNARLRRALLVPRSLLSSFVCATPEAAQSLVRSPPVGVVAVHSPRGQGHRAWDLKRASKMRPGGGGRQGGGLLPTLPFPYPPSLLYRPSPPQVRAEDLESFSSSFPRLACTRHWAPEAADATMSATGELGHGDRIQVKYDLADDERPGETEQTVWWGATVKDVQVTNDGRKIYRLLYDAFPEGGFADQEESSIEMTDRIGAVFQLEDDLTRGDIQTYRMEPEGERGVVNCVPEPEVISAEDLAAQQAYYAQQQHYGMDPNASQTSARGGVGRSGSRGVTERDLWRIARFLPGGPLRPGPSAPRDTSVSSCILALAPAFLHSGVLGPSSTTLSHVSPTLPFPPCSWSPSSSSTQPTTPSSRPPPTPSSSRLTRPRSRRA